MNIILAFFIIYSYMPTSGCGFNILKTYKDFLIYFMWSKKLSWMLKYTENMKIFILFSRNKKKIRKQTIFTRSFILSYADLDK